MWPIDWAFAQDVPTSEKLLLVAIAKCCDGQGVTFAGQRKLATMNGVTDRQVRALMARLGSKGLIVRYERRREDGTRTSDLIVLGMPRQAIDLTVYSGVLVARVKQDKVTTGSSLPVELPEGSNRGHRKDPSGHDLPEDLPVRVSARADVDQFSMQVVDETVPVDPVEPKKVDNRMVTRPEFEKARAILAEFNTVAGTHFKSKGWLEKVIRRMREHPDLDVAEHRLVVERVFAEKWWKGSPDPRVVYGNMELFEKAVNCKGTSSKRFKMEEDSSKYADVLTRSRR